MTNRWASVVEYALLVAVIFAVCTMVAMIVGRETASSFSNTGDAISEAKAGS